MDDGLEPAPGEGAELDALRIRQMTLLKRSLYRSRSYAVIAAIACAAAAAQCAWLAFRHVRAVGWGVRPVALVALMVIGAVAATWFARRALSLSDELARAALPEPTTPPDFSTLSDGSQRSKNLDELT